MVERMEKKKKKRNMGHFSVADSQLAVTFLIETTVVSGEQPLIFRALIRQSLLLMSRVSH